MGDQEYHETALPAPSAVSCGKLAYWQTAGALSKWLAGQLVATEQPHLPFTQVSKPVDADFGAQSFEVTHSWQ